MQDQETTISIFIHTVPDILLCVALAVLVISLQYIIHTSIHGNHLYCKWYPYNTLCRNTQMYMRMCTESDILYIKSIYTIFLLLLILLQYINKCNWVILVCKNDLLAASSLMLTYPYLLGTNPDLRWNIQLYCMIKLLKL